MRQLSLFLVLLFVLPVCAQQPVGPRETPPRFAPVAQAETHRIRVQNAVDGAVQVSADRGQTWRLVGRVTAPATDNVTGYLASGYTTPGTVGATAVHGIRIRVGDLGSAYPKLISILPKEFAQTPKRFGGHVSGVSGIYTNIPTGKAIFRDLSPYAGNAVYLESGDGSLALLPLNYVPRENDSLVIVVQRPVNPLREVVFENRTGGKVTATYADGTTQIVTTVIKPLLGVGRFDGTSYTGVGAVNTNHSGVITVSTAPVTTSPLLEGTGTERRGGFQIEPAYHNSRTDEAGAPQILIVGRPDKKRVPDLEGTPPLFHGCFDLSWNPHDPAHSWRAQIRRGGSAWSSLPVLLGEQPNALRGVSAIRLIRADTGDSRWRIARLNEAAHSYQRLALAQARGHALTVERGQVTIRAAAPDSRTRYVAFYIDGAFQSMSNTAPYDFAWNTTEVPDGEYVVEARAQNDASDVLSTTRTKVWVDNARRVAGR